jgi:hypothetical protein
MAQESFTKTSAQELQAIDKDKATNPTDVGGTQYETVVWDMSKKGGTDRPAPVKTPEAPNAASAAKSEATDEKGKPDAAKSPDAPKNNAEKVAEAGKENAGETAAEHLAHIEASRTENTNQAMRLAKRLDQLNAIKAQRPLETTEFIEYINASGDRDDLEAKINELGVDSAEARAYKTEEDKIRTIALNKAKRIEDALTRATSSKERVNDVEKAMKALSDTYKGNEQDPLFKAALDELIDLRTRQMKREKEASAALGLLGVTNEEVVAAAEKIVESPESKVEEEIAETGTPEEVKAEAAKLVKLFEAAQKADALKKTAEKGPSLLKRIYENAKKFFKALGNLIDGKSPAEKQKDANQAKLEKNPLADFARFKEDRSIDGRIDLVERYNERLSAVKSDSAREKVLGEMNSDLNWINRTLDKSDEVIEKMEDGPIKTQEKEKNAARRKKFEDVMSEFGYSMKASSEQATAEGEASNSETAPAANEEEIPAEVANAEAQELTEASNELQRELAELRETDPEVAARKKSLLDRLNGFTRGVKLRYLKGIVRPIKHAYRNARSNQDEELAPEYRSATTPATERRPGLKPKKGETIQEAARRQREERAAYDKAGETQEISPSVVAALNKERAANEDEAELARQIEAAQSSAEGSATQEIDMSEGNEEFEQRTPDQLLSDVEEGTDIPAAERGRYSEEISKFNTALEALIPRKSGEKMSSETFRSRIADLLAKQPEGLDAGVFAKLQNRVLFDTLNEKWTPKLGRVVIMKMLKDRNYLTYEQEGEKYKYRTPDGRLLKKRAVRRGQAA